MTKNKDIYNVSFSGSPKWGKSTNTFGFEDQTTPKYVKDKVEDKCPYVNIQDEDDVYPDSFYEALEKSKKQYEEKTNVKVFPDSIVQSVRQEMLVRAGQGFLKYNETLDRTDLSVVDYLQHAKEEAMDLALYLEKTIQMLKGNDKI